MKDLKTVTSYLNTAFLPSNPELIQNRSMSSLEKAVEFYKILPEEFEEKQTLLQQLITEQNEQVSLYRSG